MAFAERHTQLIKAKAKALGFMECRVAKAEFLEDEAPKLEKWLNQKRHGEMSYMANHFDKRLDPRKLVPGAKSVISFALNYFPKEEQNPDAPKISKYSYGKDYHFVIKDKLKAMLEFIREEIGEVDGRGFVDSAPVMDKVWAQKSGIGWVGKHTNVLSKKVGSFFFLAELIVDLDLIPDPPTTDHCGDCTACTDACPTDALTDPYEIDASKCISYLTIELKNSIPQEFKGKMDNWMFGCDVCQDVCPWNRFSKPHTTPEFGPHPNLLAFGESQWHEITEDIFREIFRKSAVKRTKFTGLKRNLRFLKEK